MKLQTKLWQKICFDTRPEIEEHMLIVMDRATHEENLCQPLQTNNKQFKLAITFLTGYKGIFIVTNKTIYSFSYHFLAELIQGNFYASRSLWIKIKK